MPINNSKYSDVQRAAAETNQSIDVNAMGDSLIMNEIHNLRSNLHLLENTDQADVLLNSNKWSLLPESYCHTFYRILGLPVIHKNKTDFYNPGWYGADDSIDVQNVRTRIDSNQDEILEQQEIKREQICFNNILNFNNTELKLIYRIDMMQSPIDTVMADTNKDMFEADAQTKDYSKTRSNFKIVSKILRPFKCVSFLCNNIEPVKNKVYAPFVNETKVLGTTLSRTYLEVVARTRFAGDISYSTKENEFVNSVKESLSTLQSSIITTDIVNNISSFSEIEAYLFSQMYLSFYATCLKVKELREQNITLGQQLAKIMKDNDIVSSSSAASSAGIKNNTLDAQIAIQKSLLAEREMMLSVLPTGTQNIDGVTLANKIDCRLNNTFLQLIQGDTDSLKSKIQELNAEQQNILSQFNAINKSSFYLLGEVYGIGLIDAIALMMSFWILPQEQLLALLDPGSFKRMLSDPRLNNTIVQKRFAATKYGYSNINVYDVIRNMDKIVFNLLQIAASIIESN